MLDLELSHTRRREMPFDTYFPLGSSPPAFGFLYTFRQLTLSPTAAYHRTVMKSTCQSTGKSEPEQPLRSCLRIVPAYENSCSVPSESNNNVPVTVSETRAPDMEKMMSSVTIQSPEEVKLNKKRVCFADSKGLRLHTVRIMDGPSDSPPTLSDSLFKDVIQNERAEPNFPYTYVPDFDQPASNYLDFRERLERYNVCLENVIIKENITIMGTVKVKNIHFEKSVKIRVTFDEWKTFRDIPTTFIFPTNVLGGEEGAAPVSNKYDTFSFQFDLPPNLAGRAAYFCVCYECNFKSFWDNNKNINYRIISLQEKETSDQEELVESYKNLSRNYPWADVSYYNFSENERPYW